MRRDTLRRQRATLMEQLKNHLPEWHYGVPEGGLSLWWATLPAPVGSALAATAERFSVRVAAGSRFAAEGLFERHLRVPFMLPEAALTEAIARLVQAYVVLTGWTSNTAARDSEGATVL